MVKHIHVDSSFENWPGSITAVKIGTGTFAEQVVQEDSFKSYTKLFDERLNDNGGETLVAATDIPLSRAVPKLMKSEVEGARFASTRRIS